MFHYRILIAAGVLQIVLLLILPALHFLIKPLLTQKNGVSLFWQYFGQVAPPFGWQVCGEFRRFPFAQGQVYYYH